MYEVTILQIILFSLQNCIDQLILNMY